MGNKLTKTVLSLAALTTMAAMVGCGQKAIKQESVLDTPDNHFSQGMRELDRNNVAEALKEFERARALNPNYAEAFAGTGLAYAYQGDFEKAINSVDQALGKNDKSYEARVIRGRVLSMRRKEGDDWVKDAAEEFDRAIKVNPNNDKAYFYKAEAYKLGYQFGPAADAYSKVIAMKGEHAGKADAEYATMQKIQRAAPGTKVGMKIALIPEIDRADLSVLLLEELKLEEVYQKKKQPTYNTDYKAPTDPTKMEQPQAEKLAAATDISTHWAKNWISDIIRLGAMEPFPDHKFYPDQLITRVNYAKTMEGILIAATGDATLATKYVGGQTRFPDVRSDHFSYNACALMVDRGIMSADKITGAFNPEGKVSGADALLIIRDFQNALRMTF